MESLKHAISLYDTFSTLTNQKGDWQSACYLVILYLLVFPCGNKNCFCFLFNIFCQNLSCLTNLKLLSIQVSRSGKWNSAFDNQENAYYSSHFKSPTAMRFQGLGAILLWLAHLASISQASTLCSCHETILNEKTPIKCTYLIFDYY